MFNLINLNDVRDEMVSEIELDAQQGNLYTSERLNVHGTEAYPKLLLSAAASGDMNSFCSSLTMGHFNPSYHRKKPKGGFTTVTMPSNANTTLCEGEFNRFYIRAVCLKAVNSNQEFITVYRARESANPRSASVALENTTFSAKALLDDLRTNVGVDTAFGLPPGPNSGMSIKL